MTQRTVVLNVVGLSESILQHAPRLRAFAEHGELRRLVPSLPAVTCTVQSSMLTGAPPDVHGIVGNGWYDRESAEVRFWKQSNHLVHAEKVWEAARRRDSSITTAVLFWWYNMYSSAEYSVTPRPIYCADGRKIPDVYAEPDELRHWLQRELGRFPLFNFWGPAASIRSTQWIADSARLIEERHRPTLSLVYLPHLDYGLQKLGPLHEDIPEEIRQVDRVAGDLIDFFQAQGVQVVVLSEYGIVPVKEDVAVNRVLRQHGLLRVRTERRGELLDPGVSRAFAVADHQLAHVYVADSADIDAVCTICSDIDGVDMALHGGERRTAGLDHARSGDLVLVAASDRWFSYPYWLDDAQAPDFARTVDIHRKPGYDPCELFLDPAISLPWLAIGSRLARKKIGLRTLMDVIPLDGELIRGSHGRTDGPSECQPIIIAEAAGCIPKSDPLPCAGVRDVIMATLFDGPDDRP